MPSRVAHTYDLEMLRLTQRAEKRRTREVRHNFEMSLYGCAKALNVGFFHILLLAVATYLAIHQRISFGDVLTFSVLFLSVMTPLNEVHRVLDEATSALDNISERCVQNALGIKDTDRTTIIIAHRLTTLKDCDHILVFEDGKISALGSYNELVAQGGLFAELVRSAETVPGSTGSPNCTQATAG